MKNSLISALCAVALSSVPLSSRTIDVAGSDYMPQPLIEALKAFAASEGDTVEVNLGGSLLALRDFEEGKADLILVALPFDRPEEMGFPVIPVGFQVGTFVVNRANPLESVTRSQLGGIYGSLVENAIVRWSDLGLSGPWVNRNIKAAFAESPDSPVVDMFSAYFLNNEPLRQGIQRFSSSIRLESFVSNNDDAIGLLDGLPLASDLKTLQIESESGGISFGPTLENVNYGDYPLAITYYACVPLSQHRFLAPYLEFLLSDDVAEILQREGFFPLLRSTRIQLVQELPGQQ